MRLSHPEVEQRLNLLHGMVYASAQLGAWCYDEEKRRIYTLASHPQEYEMILRTGGCLDIAMEKKDLPGVPCVLTGHFGIGWIAEWVHLRKGGSFLVLFGPMYLQNSSISESMQRLDMHGLSAHLRKDYMRVLGDIPFVHPDSMRNITRMLHYACYEENLSREDVIYFSVETPEPELSAAEEESGETAGAKTGNDYFRMVAHENMMLQRLAEGKAPLQGEGGYMGEVQNFKLRNALRQLKDNLIIFTALCARTAIRSGVSIGAAKSAEGRWIRRIEGLVSFGAGAGVIQEMYTEFQKMIQEASDSNCISRGVRECRDYIRANYTSELNIKDIARHCGYTEYYLTRKFYRETGMKLNDYIRQVRLEAAKVMLLTSKKDIQRISEELKFGSRSYFDRVFRSEVGVSPRQYRDTMGLEQKENNT